MRELSEQTVLVTGATDGLGRALVHRLAEHGAHVVAHGRATRASWPPWSTRSTASTGSRSTRSPPTSPRCARWTRWPTPWWRSTTRSTCSSTTPASASAPRAPPATSQDGIELRFAVNHLAGYHLAQRLRLLLETSAPSRIVQVASAGQLPLDPDDPLTETDYDGVTAYRRAKLAQVMATFDLAADLVGTGVSVNAVHPATMMATTMVRETGWEVQSTLEEGLDATWPLLADPAMDDVSGRYFDRTHPADPDPQADDPAARAWVRQLNDELIAQALG